MELRVKTEILKTYIYGPTFGNAESRLFLLSTLPATKITLIKMGFNSVA
jgi:hypothetical protein